MSDLTLSKQNKYLDPMIEGFDEKNYNDDNNSNKLIT
jgi:hypothetical protein